MKTITIQIGNSDDKLTQSQWAEFVSVVKDKIYNYAGAIHFFGAPSNFERWQNAAWVITCDERIIEEFKDAISIAGKRFRQDSVAWIEGEIQFV